MGTIVIHSSTNPPTAVNIPNYVVPQTPGHEKPQEHSGQTVAECESIPRLHLG